MGRAEAAPSPRSGFPGEREGKCAPPWRSGAPALGLGVCACRAGSVPSAPLLCRAPGRPAAGRVWPGRAARLAVVSAVGGQSSLRNEGRNLCSQIQPILNPSLGPA